jgi:hypothetical protein
VPAGGGQNAELVANRVAGGNPLDEELDWQPRPTEATPTVTITEAKVNRRTHGLTVAFTSTGPATGYRCALSEGKRKPRFRPCHSPATYAHLRRGRHMFEVIASGPGETYRHAAVRRFTLR